jgi:6,7-dimethyl-8-ribityllumazine synthase
MHGPIPSRPRPTQQPLDLAIVASIYNSEFVDGMLEAARDEIQELAPNASITCYRVPGAYEIPVCTELVLRSSRPDVVIALGVIIRGATGHADLVAASVTDALQRSATSHCIPVIHEVLLVEDASQAEERCLSTEDNRGTEAARTAITMVRLFDAIHAKFDRSPED